MERTPPTKTETNILSAIKQIQDENRKTAKLLKDITNRLSRIEKLEKE